MIRQEEESLMTKEEKARKWYSYITVEPVLFLFYLCAGASTLVEEHYVFHILSEQFNYTESSSSSNACYSENQDNVGLQQQVQSLSSQGTQVLFGIGTALGIIASLYLGGYSDKSGRKPVMLISLAGTALKFFIFSIIMSLNQSYWYLSVGYVVSGLIGASAMPMAMSCAYVADTAKDDLVIKLAVLEACYGTGKALGLFISGYLTILTFGYANLLFFGLIVICFLYTIFVVSDVKDKYDSSVSLFQLEHMTHSLKSLAALNPNKFHRRILIVNLIIVIICLAGFVGSGAPTTYFLRGQPLCFSPVSVGIYTACSQLLAFCGPWVGLNLFGRKVGDFTLMFIGLLCAVIHEAFFAFVTKLWMVIVGKFLRLLLCTKLNLIKFKGSIL